jgi:hypothetical protein
MALQETEASVPSQTRIGCLERLGEELVKRGYLVRLTFPVGRSASLHVVNPASSLLSENILAERGMDGRPYLWSWDELIGAVDDTAGTADLIVRVLAA